MWPGQGREGLEDGVERCRALGPVEEQGPFSVFDRFRVPLLEDPGGACVAGFAGRCVRTYIGYIALL